MCGGKVPRRVYIFLMHSFDSFKLHFFIAVAPEPVANCTTINPSAEHFRLSCKPGFDGGMEQFFEVIVRENNSGSVVFNLTINSVEKLDIRNLSAGVSYIATVTPR